MAITHEIRTKDGTEHVQLTPVKAMRKMCLECAGWMPSEVRKCSDKACTLFIYRSGTRPISNTRPIEVWYKENPLREVTLGPVKTIRQHCLSCMGGSYDMVRECSTTLCALHSYRLGKRPNE